MPTLAPIAIFAFNRPDHLRRTIEALAANELAEQSHVTFFCDGPRDPATRPEDAAKCAAVRKIARDAQGFASVEIVAHDKNQGLAPSIIAGVSSILQSSERVIVIEDDLVTSPYFLRFMNDGLDCYANNERVASIHGYCFPHKISPNQTTFFLKGADCLGWGTWRRAWAKFEPDALLLLNRLQQENQIEAFNRNGAYDYSGMLQGVIDGKISSWAVRWLASTWLENMFTLHPCESLIFHNGSDASGTNCGVTSVFDVPLSKHPIKVLPLEVVEDEEMAKQLTAWLRKCSGGNKHLLKRWIVSKFPFLRTIKRLVCHRGIA